MTKTQSVSSINHVNNIKNSFPTRNDFLEKNLYDKNSFGPFLVGFDRIFDELTKIPITKNISYPPYNIKKIDNINYTIEIAAAGFSKENIDINLEDSLLTISGKIEDSAVNEYIYKGISNREFKREFKLSDTVEVSSAKMVNGMLIINLKNNIPDHKLPRKIEIL